MKLTLIKPTIGRREHSLYVDEGRMEPLMLGVLAALTPPDVEVVLHDDRMEAIPYDIPTDLVAITVETYTARRAYEIAAEYRQRGVPVILGGMHVALLPEEAERHADSIFVGDAETGWAQVIADARQGKLRPRYNAPAGVAQMGGVIPRRDLFAGKGYLPITLMQFSRGCRFACNFCAVSQYFGKRHYLRRIDEVVNEITAQNRHFLFFVDDNIASDRAALKELCHALIPLNVHWISQASLDVTRDPELMRLMERSGCWGHVMGFESITPRACAARANHPIWANTPTMRAKWPCCASTACKPGRHSPWGMTTTPPKALPPRWTLPCSTASPLPPTTSSCPIPAPPCTANWPRKAACCTTAAGGCTPHTASTTQPLCLLA